MRMFAVLSIVWLVAGCSDSATSRLTRGSEMVVRSPERPPGSNPALKPGEFDGNALAGRAVWMKIGSLSGAGAVEAGAKVRVISDDQSPDVRSADKDFPDSDGSVDRRLVKVKILDGANAQIVGELPRNTLRPVR